MLSNLDSVDKDISAIAATIVKCSKAAGMYDDIKETVLEMCVELTITEFEGITASDIKTAFKLFAAGKLIGCESDKIYAGQMNALLFSKIINCYLLMKSKTEKQVMRLQQEKEAEKIKKETEAEKNEAVLNDFRAKIYELASLNLDIHEIKTYWYNFLQNLRLINTTGQQFEEAMIAVKDIAFADYEKETNDNNAKKKINNNFTLVLTTTKEDFQIVYAKRKIVQDYFKYIKTKTNHVYR